MAARLGYAAEAARLRHDWVPRMRLSSRPICRLVLACGVATTACARAADDTAGAPAVTDGVDGESREPAAGRLQVPPVPDGTPAELLAYIEGLTAPERMPSSRGRRRFYLRKAMANAVEATDRILGQLEPDSPVRGQVLRLKFDALERLSDLGDRRAADLLAAFAATLVDGADAALAAEARAVATRAEIDSLLADGRVDDAPALVRRLADLLEAAPGDVGLAESAADFARKLGRAPGGEAASRLAHDTFVPLLEKSTDARIAALGRRLAGSMRLLTLCGKPMPIAGRLLGGGEFDQAALAGKVVLVDFWATWCGPCVAEIENIREQYERYHERGFEVLGISLDDDRAVLERFVADRRIPWPILVDAAAAPAGAEAMADRYGITGIPQCILIGADGAVISTSARGVRLARLLEEQLPAAKPPAP